MYSQYTAKDIERFWGKVDKDSSPIFYSGTRCWEWKGARHSQGYGAAWMGNKYCRSNRVAYELIYGEIQDGLQVLHHCDNPPCCNPLHFFLGTTQDNVDDRMKKGRQGNSAPKHPARREMHGMVKLTQEQVAEIRRRYAWHGIGGENSYELARALA